MKKLIALAIALSMLLCLTACGGAGSTESQNPSSGTNEGGNSSQGSGSVTTHQDSGKITLGEAELSVGMVITEEIIAKIGEPDDVMTAPSCFFDGEDAIYIYEDFSLYTYLDGDKNYLYIIELSTSENQTALGCKVGMEIGEVEEIYGMPTSSTATAKTYSLGENSKLRFSFDENETVVLIEYELIG